MTETIFSKIIKRELPADIVYEDDQCLAFKDVNPQAPMHILIIPKKNIVSITNAGLEDESVLGHMMLMAGEISRQQGFDDFRVVINNGAKVGQTVFHLHLHILAGRSFHWPPG